MILLDTNAIVWVLAGHERARPLLAAPGRRYVSPVSLLELRFLQEVGRVDLAGDAAVSEIAADPRWALDDPPASLLFRSALDVGWTRDPFDRLLVAHAACRRLRLATGDRRILGHLGPDAVLAL